MGLRYGQGKYNEFRYGPSEAGFQFKVQISDSAGNVVALLNNQVVTLNWSYERIGGCGDFSMELKRTFDDIENLTSADRRSIYDLQIFITPSFGGSSALYYRGYISSIRPNLEDNERVIVSGVGYSDRLKNIQVNDGTGAPKEYTSSTISGVVTSLINDFITPSTPITAGTIDTFSTTVTSIKFNESAYDAIQKLADLVGAEFGVDRNREIYFLAPSNSVSWRFKRSRDIEKIEDEYDYSEIVNRVYIEGGQIAGVPFRYVKSDDASINNYGLREKRVVNSSVVDAVLAESLADSILTKQREQSRNLRIRLPFNTDLIEESTPLGLFSIVTDPKPLVYKYGSFKYGEQKYCGEETQKINRIDYEIRDVSLMTEIESNEGKPDIIENFNLLQFQLDQQRQTEGV